MFSKLTSFAVCSALLLPAQEKPAPADAPVPALPTADSPQATQLLGRALDKMQAYGRGTFRTTESTDHAVMRQAGIPIGANDIEVSGGWHRELIWGDCDGNEFICGNGRMLAKVDGSWRLRRSKLAGGRPLPFTLDPDLLFTILQQLPATARKVVNVEAGKVRGRDVAILSLQLDDETALDFADSGAVPDIGGGFASPMMFGGGGFEPPRPELVTFLALWIDPESGDLVRLGVKVFERNPMFGNIQIAVAGNGQVAEVVEEEEGDKDKEQAGGAAPQWKRGFPNRKPEKDESVMTYQVDFDKLGLAEQPPLEGEQKALLRMR